jgi:subtilase family protein
MRQWCRAAVGTSLVLLMVAAASTPGMAAAAPRPLPSQWWFTAWGVQDRLWPKSQGEGITIGLVDTGVEASIPDLSSVVLSGANPGPGGGDGRTDLDDAEVPGHGTGMASLIASQGTSTGFLGIAPKAKILPVVSTRTTDVAPAIRYAADRGVQVISISQADPQPCPADVQKAVAYALDKDIVIVAGAGNDGDGANGSNFPANCSGVLAVGAVDNRFNPWDQTQRKSYVAVAAPGAPSSVIAKDGRVHPSQGGTSQSTALTSAVVALVRSKFPDMSARQVVQQIISSAGDVGPKGRDDQTGYGLIRPTRILQGAVPRNGPNPVFDAYDKWKAANADQTGAVGSRSNADGSGSSTNYVLIGGFGAMIVAVIVVLFVVLSKNRRRLQAARAGQYGAGPGGPPAFGGPYPPQGGQPPAPGGQQPYYPPAGPQGGPPQQGPYPNPGQPGQWGAPDQRP